MTKKQPAEALYQQLKQDILDNKLPTGCPLKQVQLSEQYGVSRIPIRDVIQRLKNDGWLAPIGKRGVMVLPLSADEAEDLYMMRAYLEPLILSYAIPNLNHQTLGLATDILVQLDRPDLSVQQHGELNWDFHSALYRAAERPTLFNTINQLHQQCARYIGFHSVELAYIDTSQQEHYQLLDAIKVGQVQRAQSILEQHICDAGKLMVSYLHKRQR